jgi:adenylate cyclase
MECPFCQSDTPDKAKFCNECGNKIEHNWLQSKTDIADNKTFVIDGERKYITVMFSDLSDFTAMSEKMDIEEVKEIMGNIFPGAGLC